MPLRLRDTFPKGYEDHNSSGEHWSKHAGDADRINEIRWGRKLRALDRSELLTNMRNGGVVLTNKLKGREFGKPAGYIAASRKDGDVTVDDFWVRSTERSRGIGGTLLGKLITNVPYDTSRYGLTVLSYGNWLDIGGNTLALPGIHITVHSGDIPEDSIEELVEAYEAGSRFKTWSGIRSIDGGEHFGHVVYCSGKQVGQIEHREGGYVIAGQQGSLIHDQVVFAAFELLNGPIPQLVDMDDSQSARS